MADTKSWPHKHPDEVLSYGIDFSQMMAGDPITSVTWDVPTGLNVMGENVTDFVAEIYLSGGTDQRLYIVKALATGTNFVPGTATRLVYEQSVSLFVTSR